MRNTAVAVLAFVFALSAARAQTVTFTGTTRLDTGAPVGGVTVRAVPIEPGRDVVTASSASDGSFRLAGVVAGSWVLDVAAPDRLVSKVDVEIRRGRGAPEHNVSDPGPAQAFPRLVLTAGATVVCDIEIAPANHWAGSLTGPQAQHLNEMLGKAADLTARRDFAGSDKLAAEVRAQAPDAPGPLLLLGINAARDGRGGEAETLLGEALRRDPKLRGARTELGRVALAQHDPAGALDWFEKELATNGADGPALVGRAMALEQLGRRDDAIEAWQDVRRHAPAEAQAYQALVALYLDANRPDDAARTEIALADVGAPDARAWYNIGARFVEAGRRDPAEDAFRSALGLEPSLAEAHRELGLLLQQRGDVDGARTQLRAYLFARPDARDADDVRRALASMPAAPRQQKK